MSASRPDSSGTSRPKETAAAADHRGGNGRAAAGNFRFGILHQEPASARLRQPCKALLTCVKEADNALDACEEAGILPDVSVKLEVVSNGEPVAPSQASKFRITVTDNGPGIIRQHIPAFLPTALRLKVPPDADEPRPTGNRNSAAGMYGPADNGQTGQDHFRTSPRAAAHFFEVQIDTKKNEPLVHENKQIEWEQAQGTQVTLEVEGISEGTRVGRRVARTNDHCEPHVRLVYHTPEGETKEYARGVSRTAAFRGRSNRIPTASNSGCCSRCCRIRKVRQCQVSSPVISAGSLLNWRPTSARKPRCPLTSSLASSRELLQKRCIGRFRTPRLWRLRPIAFPPSAKRRFCRVSTDRSKASSTRPAAGRRSIAATRSSSKQAWLSATGPVNSRSRSNRPDHERKGRKKTTTRNSRGSSGYANRVPSCISSRPAQRSRRR